jgi:hypothetical protein
MGNREYLIVATVVVIITELRVSILQSVVPPNPTVTLHEYKSVVVGVNDTHQEPPVKSEHVAVSEQPVQFEQADITAAVAAARRASEVPLEELERAFHQERYRQLNDTTVEDMLVWMTSNTTDGTRCSKFLAHFDYHRMRENNQSTFYFPQDKKYKFIYADSRQAGICHAARAWHEYKAQHNNAPYPHVLFFGFHEDWGGMNSKYTRFWKRKGCPQNYIMQYVESDDMKAAFTLQSHAWDHPKIHSYALGYRFEIHAHSILSNFRMLSPHQKKTKMVMFNNNVNHSRQARMMCLKILQHNLHGITTIENTFDKKNGLNDYYQEMATSQFIVSPTGVGVDCYRNYEAVFMGSIPIIQREDRPDGWVRTLEDMPVAFVANWTEVTPEWIQTTYRQVYERNYEKPYNWKKLKASWWINHIKSFVEENHSDAATTAS